MPHPGMRVGEAWHRRQMDTEDAKDVVGCQILLRHVGRRVVLQVAARSDPSAPQTQSLRTTHARTFAMAPLTHSHATAWRDHHTPAAGRIPHGHTERHAQACAQHTGSRR